MEDLRILVLAEAEAAKFATGFRNDIKILESARMTYENIDSAAHSSMSLKKITAQADKLLRRTQPQNLTREFKLKYAKKAKKLDAKATSTPTSLPKKEAAITKTPRELLKEVKSLKTSAKIPTIDKPMAGVNVEPITKLEFEIESAIFKRAENR